VENELLRMKRESKDKKERDIILQAIEVLDNIYTLLDELETIPYGELKKEIVKLTQIQTSFPDKNKISLPAFKPDNGKQNITEEKKLSNNRPIMSNNLYNLKTLVSSSEPTKKSSNAKSIPQFQITNMSQLMMSQANFKFHPDVKYKSPIQKQFKQKEFISDSGLTSPLDNLLEVAKKYSSLGSSLIEFSSVLESSFNAINSLKEKELVYEDEHIKEDFSIVMEEILKRILKMSHVLTERESGNELHPSITELEKLNIKFVDLQKKMSQPENEVDEFSKKIRDDVEEDFITETFEIDETEELIRRMESSMKEEDFITETFVMIYEKTIEFFEGKIDEHEFKNVLNKVKISLQNARKNYEESYISPEEWTVEVAAGDRLFMEGINEFEEGLHFLESHSVTREEEKINEDIRKIYEANKKLVMNQHLAEYINKLVCSIGNNQGFRKFSF
jgi:hypothetical protein